MTSEDRLGRRRFLTIAAAGAGLGLLAPQALAGPPRFESWEGTALGAQASIRLHHPDPAVARRLIEEALAEIERLESVFSLYRSDSAVSRLNREGALEAPPLDLVLLLSEARRSSEITGGAFDVTVQPLWQLYAKHFSEEGAASGGPSSADLAAALARVDYRALAVDPSRIAFERPGMAITLNGIAQGYVTDRVAALFRRAGLEDVLIDLGEIRALGRHPEGRPWEVGLADPEVKGEITRRLSLSDAALATSAGSGTLFERSGRHHHLLDPASGRSSAHHLPRPLSHNR